MPSGTRYLIIVFEGICVDLIVWPLRMYNNVQYRNIYSIIKLFVTYGSNRIAHGTIKRSV